MAAPVSPSQAARCHEHPSVPEVINQLQAKAGTCCYGTPQVLPRAVSNDENTYLITCSGNIGSCRLVQAPAVAAYCFRYTNSQVDNSCDQCTPTRLSVELLSDPV